MEKKSKMFIGMFIISMFIVLFSSMAFVSALDFDFQSSANQLIQWIKDIFGPFFSVLIGTGEIDEYLFARVLLLIIIYTMVLVVLKKVELFKNNKGAIIIIAVAVSILGVRFIATKALVDLILLPYGTMAIALSIFVPFLIYFFFIHYSVQTGLGRKLGWILFAAVFFGLWYTRQDSLGEYDLIYIIAIIGFILVLIFDNKIHEYFGLFEARRERNKRIRDNIISLENQIQSTMNYTHGTTSQDRKDKIKELEDQIKYWKKQQSRW